MSTLAALMLALLFIHPLKLPAGGRLWMFLPLALCVTVVYRATRARTAADLPRATVISFVQIVVGMCLIAVAFYLVHEAVLRFS
ncbi:MAG: hypothetical protein KKB50_16330 [Planctomycetes bacterium]|nr:hypothetical protein [Planctomycetota bacterium]